MSRIYIRAS